MIVGVSVNNTIVLFKYFPYANIVQFRNNATNFRIVL